MGGRSDNVWLLTLTRLKNKKGAWLWVPREALDKIGAEPGGKVLLVLERDHLRVVPVRSIPMMEVGERE